MSNEKINFALQGSLINLFNTGDIPNFNRPSSVQMERIVDGGLQTYAIDAYRPAFYSETGAFLLEPFSVNLVQWSTSFEKNVWQKGPNITVRPDLAALPDGTYQADVVTWAQGDGNNQLIRQTLSLEAATDYYISFFVLLAGGQFTTNDVLRVSGDVAQATSISLSALNQTPKRYQIIELPFKTGGTRPKLPNNHHQAVDYQVTAVNGSTLTLQVTPASGTVAAGDLLGGQIAVSGITSKYFNIIASGALSNGTVLITTDAFNLASEGVTTANRAIIRDAPPCTVNLELYSESTATVHVGGIQLEPKKFRTSMIYQEDSLTVRGAAVLSYRKSPIAKKKTFALYTDILFWRGDGTLFDFGNLSAWLQDGKLYVQAGSTVISTASTVPSKDLKLLIQVAEENSSLSVYINNVLHLRTNVSNFVADTYAPLVMTSEGVRAYRLALTTDSLLLDGQPLVGGQPTGEVYDLFVSPVVIDAVAISAHAPVFVMPPVTIPALEPPIAKQQIQSINTGTGLVGVPDSSNFAANTSVTVLRGKKVILWTNLNTKNSATTVTLASTSGVLLGDTLVYGNIDTPGRTSARYPFDPVDSQAIQAIDAVNFKLTLASTLSFGKARAFIYTDRYQDIAEVIVTDTDNINKTLTVNSVTGYAVGDIISQPKNELWVDPPNVHTGILKHTAGVTIAQKYQNGVVLENTNPVPVTVRPYGRVHL